MSIGHDVLVSLRQAFTRPARQQLRRLTDRLLLPYVDRIDASITALDRSTTAGASEPDDEPDPPVSLRFHMTLHALREIELARLRGERNRVLSVGANGAWYFEWFRNAVGDVHEHIGIEAYVPRPDDLPPYVTWIANSADRMADVDSGSVDLVFAGQVTEHMWPDELAGFLAEAHRVLRPGGVLALDSPNRRITQHLHWSHGEHTIELDPDEIGGLLQLSGFDVTSVAGLWQCEIDGRVWELEEGIDAPDVLTRRIVGGRDRPGDSFCWWVNAERSSRPVDRSALDRRLAELFAQHWPTRVSRGMFPAVGRALPAARHLVASTLPFPLRPGTWDVTVRLAVGSWDQVDQLLLTISPPGGGPIHTLTLADAHRDGAARTWRFEQPHLLFALVAQLTVEARAEIAIAFPLEVEPR